MKQESQTFDRLNFKGLQTVMFRFSKFVILPALMTLCDCEYDDVTEG